MIDVTTRVAPRPSTPAANWILGRLVGPEHDLFLSRLQLVSLRFGARIYDAGDALTHVYFPVRGTLSLMSFMADGEGLEVTSTDKHGCYGFTACAELSQSQYQVSVQSEGEAYRMEAGALREELVHNQILRRSIDVFHAALLKSVSQSATCNGLHTVVQRCCRWLLEAADRIEANDLRLTHDFVAAMLGVRRPSVSDVFAGLQTKGLIGHVRGKTTIVDRSALEQRACECYNALKESRRRLLEA